MDTFRVRRQIYRAKRARAISGPIFTENFERDLAALIDTAIARAGQHETTLNSGCLDSQTDSELGETAADLGKMIANIRESVQMAAVIRLDRSEAIGPRLQSIDRICNRLESIREGILLSLNDDFTRALAGVVATIPRPETIHNR